MNKLIKLAFVAGLTLVSMTASAAILCPPTSCNVHNGCMDGCANYTAIGSAACNPIDPKVSEKEALNQGQHYAQRKCAYGFFLTSKWQVYQIETTDQCQVRAEATFSCFQ